MGCLPSTEVLQMWWGNNTRAWIIVHPSTVNGTDLGAQKWRDDIFLHYGIEPPYLTKICDRCGERLSIAHVVYCNKGRLFTNNNNNLPVVVSDLVRKAFMTSHVHNDPLIHTGCDMWGVKAHLAGKFQPKNSPLFLGDYEKNIDLLIWYL